MSSFTQELRWQHRELLRTLDGTSLAGVETEAGRARLLELEPFLRAHLQLEAEGLYPVLDRAAERDTNLAWLLRSLMDDTAELSAEVGRFFDRLTCAPSYSAHEIVGDFGRLVGALKGSILREEGVLFPEYERVTFRVQGPSGRARSCGKSPGFEGVARQPRGRSGLLRVGLLPPANGQR